MSRDASVSIPLRSESFVEISKSPFIYEVPAAGSMVTAIRNCEKRKNSSTTALWRQLLVGLKEIDVAHQERTELEGKEVLLSVFTAKLDEAPIRMACFTLADAECVTDYVMWQKSADQTTSLQDFEAGLAELEHFVRAELGAASDSPPRLMVNSLRSSDDL